MPAQTSVSVPLHFLLPSFLELSIGQADWLLCTEDQIDFTSFIIFMKEKAKSAE